MVNDVLKGIIIGADIVMIIADDVVVVVGLAVIEQVNKP